MVRTKLQSSLDADVIIVGAGITGLVLAGLLARNHFRIGMVEARGDTDKDKDTGTDPRALAVTPCSAQILMTVGAWPLLAPSRVGHFRKMQVWDANGRGKIEFDSAELYQPTLGYIVESRILSNTLQTALAGTAGITWYQPAQAESLDISKEKAVLALADGRHISAKLVVAADGKNSRIRSLGEISFLRHEYDQEALACIVKTERPHEDIARQRFLSDGTLAFLPMSDPHECGIVWSTRPVEAQQLCKIGRDDFHFRLQTGIDGSLGAVMDSGPRIGYPLAYGAADDYVKDRLALIGDAAHVVHPLAGQGANLGILDAAALSQIITETATKDRDIGEWLALRRYERWRKGENQLMMHALTGFKELFTNQMFPLPVIRNLGLDITDHLPLLKHRIMQYAMGLRGDLPDTACVPV